MQTIVKLKNMRYEDYLKPLWGLWWGLVACALTSLLLGSCAARRPLVAGNGTYRADTVVRNSTVRDTLVLRDSVAVETYVRGDTVFRDKVVWRWRDHRAASVDTVWRNSVRSDTIRVPVPVERKLTWWERAVERPLEKAVGVVIAAVDIAAAWWLARRWLRKRKED